MVVAAIAVRETARRRFFSFFIVCSHYLLNFVGSCAPLTGAKANIRNFCETNIAQYHLNFYKIVT